jgi:hypothetical protein
MDTKFQTSFIPKKMAQTQERKSSVSLFLLISIIIFLIALGLTAFVFLEKQTLKTSIASEQDIIKKNINSFEPATIENIVELNSRISVANTLLKNHVAVSPIFDFLQGRTLKNVRFKNFNFSQASKDTSGVSGVQITMAGQSRDWATLASQADEFGKSDWKKIIQEPKISNFNLNADGSVSFTFTAFINPEFLVYKNNSGTTQQ